MTEPLRLRWSRDVIPSMGPGDDTIVACLDQHGQPVALFLDDELREALGLQLLLPDGDGEVDPQYLELARENERLRAAAEDTEHKLGLLYASLPPGLDFFLGKVKGMRNVLAHALGAATAPVGSGAGQ